jgi:hypothetical protein
VNGLIIFNFNSKKKLPKNFPKDYPNVLKFEGEFFIEIEKKKFFNDPHFSIFEFLLFVEQWLNNKNKNANMEYCSLDTNENPLISFTNANGAWKIYSPWQHFECEKLFSRNDLEKSITKLTDKLH